jgi:predicted aldo/keto reductase-like oxidoreductase
MPALKITDTLPLPNTSVRIPRLGFGVYRSPTNQCVQSCLKALDAGYRHIDTAQFYANEAEVGEALRTSGVPREEVFVTTKILSPAASIEATYDKLLASVHKISGVDGYVDLFLIHSSSSGSAGRKLLWQALEKLYAEGKAKSIGVSNFGVGHIEEMRSYAQVFPPHVNQIEVRYQVLKFCSYWLFSVMVLTFYLCSSTRGASSASLMNTARATELLLKPIHLLCETTKPMTPHWWRLRRRMATRLSRS